MCSEPVSLLLQVAKVSVSTGGRTRQLPFIPLLCDQVADQRLHPWHQFTDTWRVSTMIIITFSIIPITSITLLLIFHHCLSSKSSLKVSSNPYENLPPHFKRICHSRSLGEEVKQRFSAPVGLQLQTAILYVWCCKSAPGRDSASLKMHTSCQLRTGCWCFHVCNRAGHLSTGHICYEPYHHRNVQVNDFFESESFWIYCRKKQIVSGEKELNHHQSNIPQRQQTLHKHVQPLLTASHLGAFELFTLLTAHFI